MGWLFGPNFVVALIVIAFVTGLLCHATAHSLHWVVGVLVLCLIGSDFRAWSVRFGKTGKNS
ncbi:hypothetical protein D7W82_25640 [Corallococcus sp. CA049B]|uniref:hypothetical protein n=1 Tax=Corallococcus sp. CA049B TaxID=2316730 RepID=UPI000EA2B373|nr:hypothetical protein [Corallococcus sp. CA049B]NOJ96219.1 hypothetical protein [Corallococcus coralloides]RKG83111.1 hypothetical protein D7W82_25640 [Corallococcus sp. CA049B]